MGWGITINVDTPIPMEVAEEIVERLPEVFRDHWAAPGSASFSKQVWGWSALVDINNPEGTKWRISGAHFSLQHAVAYANVLCAGLRDKGFSVLSVEYPDGMFKSKDFTPALPHVDWTRRFNFNDTVTVTLTDRGLEVYRATRPLYPKLDGRQVSLQLWELANIFGEHLGHGFPDVFVGTWFDIQRMVKPDGQ